MTCHATNEFGHQCEEPQAPDHTHKCDCGQLWWSTEDGQVHQPGWGTPEDHPSKQTNDVQL